MQVAGMARNMFSYSIIVAAREALPSRPNPEVNSLADLEKVLRVRLQTGAPGPSGQVDPDGVGNLAVANLRVCCGGNSGGSFEVHPFHLIAPSATWHFAGHARALRGGDWWQSGQPARAVRPERDASSGPCTEAFQRGAPSWQAPCAGAAGTESR